MDRRTFYDLREEGPKGEEDLVFQVVSWHVQDAEDEDEEGEGEGEEDEEEKKKDESAFLMKAFGVTAEGRSVGLTVRGYRPYFYVSVPDFLAANPKSLEKRLPEALTNIFRDKLGKRRADDFLGVKYRRKKNFWGFRAGQKDPFGILTFRRESARRAAANLLKKESLKIGSTRLRLSLFESNIPPLLRFVHERDIQAAGWLRVPRSHLRVRRWCGDGGDDDYDFALPSTDRVDVDGEVHWEHVEAHDNAASGGVMIAPMLVAAFDIECTSSHGDFPVAVKDYRRVCSDLESAFKQARMQEERSEYEAKQALVDCLGYALGVRGVELPAGVDSSTVQRAHLKPGSFAAATIRDRPEEMVHTLRRFADEMYGILVGRVSAYGPGVSGLNALLSGGSGGRLPELLGDPVIQIGTTFHRYGESACSYRHVVTLGSCAAVEGVDVVSCATEEEVLLTWRDMMQRMDPDVVTGYNVMGFDMAYLRDRACELGVERPFLRLGRLDGVACEFVDSVLSSSALGDNVLRYIRMQGRTLVDLMKVVQKDHKLDMYGLNFVAKHFTGEAKDDVSPADVFRLHEGTAGDRAVVARYCVQDCALCNRLMAKLEVVANNVGMANVCSVPLEFIFLRGQGVKIFSLVARQCRRDGFLVPVVKGVSSDAAERAVQAEAERYEGAIVLDPRVGMYMEDPVVVLDYASLYPSSMISENISHDSLVLDPAFDHLPGVTYTDVTYEDAGGVPRTCRFAQPASPSDGAVLPRILDRLLRQRKLVRQQLKHSSVELRDGRVLHGVWSPEQGRVDRQDGVDAPRISTPCDPADVVAVRPRFSDFELAILDGLQNAYKVTANSLYGQMGAATSQLYLKDVAACTTATGRDLILKAKAFMENHMDADVVYGDTDSLFMVFDLRHPDTGERLRGQEALAAAIRRGQEASEAFRPHLKPPHNMEYDKTFFPFVIFTKKRYLGNLYEEDPTRCKRKYMGVAIKRRDCAAILKTVYGGVLDRILDDRDIPGAVAYLRSTLEDIAGGRIPIEQFVITKTLRASYADPDRIAHSVLARRIGDRDPGNKPQSNDRIPYVFVQQKDRDSKDKASAKKELQGDRIEDPGFAVRHRLRLDYKHYISNQIMNPLVQLFTLVLEDLEGYRRPRGYWGSLRAQLTDDYEGDAEHAARRVQTLRERDVIRLLFEPILTSLEVARQDMKPITHYFRPVAAPAVPPAPAPARAPAQTAGAAVVPSTTRKTKKKERKRT